MNDPEFWSDKKTSDEAVREAKSLRARWEPLRALESRLTDAGELLTMARAEDDASAARVEPGLDERDREREQALMAS